uniref:Uncharacterized protein n=1 Tax=Magallana gigas TaxID=29159 RepID=A0A8W8LQ19_MAGGI
MLIRYFLFNKSSSAVYRKGYEKPDKRGLSSSPCETYTSSGNGEPDFIFKLSTQISFAERRRTEFSYLMRWIGFDIHYYLSACALADF